jgi:hypothetical protein
MPKTEMVYELKDKFEVPTFERFMETYEVDERIVSSYMDEISYVNI